MHRFALPCPALPCPALPCPALLCSRGTSPEKARLRKMVEDLRVDRQRLEDRLCSDDPKVRACVRAWVWV